MPVMNIRIVQCAVIAVTCLFISNAFGERAIRAPQSDAYSEQRVALVIGNGNYASSPLKNPVNDAKDISAKLKALGFEVTCLLDANQVDMRKAIRDFGSNLKKGGVGLFYYAGHGMQVKGANYLIPIGADIHEEDEVEDYAVDAGMVLRKMQSAENRLNIVLLDACRNNPFARSFRSGSRGLAQMDAPSGSMISYATAPGSTAADGEGRNGMFTKHFLTAIDKYGDLELSQLMKKVGRGVQDETHKMQIPWVSSSITGDFFFKFKATPARQEKNTELEKAPASALTIDEEEEFWLAIKNSSLVQDFKDYMAMYPDGRFKKIAEIKIRQLSKTPEPKKEAEVTTFDSFWSKDSVRLFDTFSSNENAWSLWPDGQYYTTAIQGGSFVMETRNELNSAEFMGKSLSLPENYDIEVDSTWLSGVDNRSYGLALGTEAQNRFNFSVSGNGWAMVSGYRNNQLITPNPIEWTSGLSMVGDGRTVNTLKLKVRGGSCDFLVNDRLVGTVFITLPRSQLRVGFFVENLQRIAFDNLKITSRSVDPVPKGNLFYDSFNANDNAWNVWTNGEYYNAILSGGSYCMETKNNLNSTEFPGKIASLPANFDISVTTTWKKGVDNFAYGLALGTDPQNRYNFGISGNGWSYVSAHRNNAVVQPDPKPWTFGNVTISNGWNQNVIRIQVRGTRYDFYVNGTLVGTVTLTLPHESLRVGVFAENMQEVCFDDLTIEGQ